jgi:hypothetical protein
MRASFGAAIFDSWAIDPAVQREALGQPASRGSSGGGGRGGRTATGSGGGTGSSGAGSSGAGTFDRTQRRAELEQQALALLNADTPAGQPEITELTDSQRQQIERQLDAEAGSAAGGANGRGQGSGDDDRVRTWGQFAGELRYGAADMVTSAFGIDLAADEVRTLRGRDAAAAGTDGAAATGAGGAAATHDPTRPVSDSGRPLIDSDDLDLDELAGRLYDRLRSRLRLELLLDRERAGLLTDFR